MAKPLLKWVGGKRKLAPRICPAIVAHLTATDGTYYEPFLGGGAIALEMGLFKAYLSDVNEQLMETYFTVRGHAGKVYDALRWFASCGVTREAYLAVRDLDMDDSSSYGALPCPPGHESYWRAARFVYLNYTCFNGLHRENRAGKFNVPYGALSASKLADPMSAFPDRQVFDAFAVATHTAMFGVESFESALSYVENGDAVYCDPPYADTFTSYSSKGFNLKDQETLGQLLREASDRGAMVVASNADTPDIRRIYSWARIITTEEQHAVAAAGDKRAKLPTVLITNAEEIS